MLGLRGRGQGRRWGALPGVQRSPASLGPLGNVQTRASPTLAGYQLDREPSFVESNSSPSPASQGNRSCWLAQCLLQHRPPPPGLLTVQAAPHRWVQIPKETVS